MKEIVEKIIETEKTVRKEVDAVKGEAIKAKTDADRETELIIKNIRAEAKKQAEELIKRTEREALKQKKEMLKESVYSEEQIWNSNSKAVQETLEKIFQMIIRG